MKPSPAMIVASIALVSSMTGGAVAATSLKSNSVGSAQIRPRSVHLSDLAVNARPGAISKARAAQVVESVITDPTLGLNITVKGEKGEKGDPGVAVAGPQGPQGAAGANGVPVVNLRTASTSVPAGSSVTLGAQCVEGEKVTGGGATLDGPSETSDSGPSGENSWSATMVNRDSVARTMSVTAICTVVR
jgi:hypothetical protein